jgi:hypothetical protein
MNNCNRDVPHFEMGIEGECVCGWRFCIRARDMKTQILFLFLSLPLSVCVRLTLNFGYENRNGFLLLFCFFDLLQNEVDGRTSRLFWIGSERQVRVLCSSNTLQFSFEII